MKIKKVKCNGCAKKFDEDKITMINERYLCDDCLKIVVKDIREIAMNNKKDKEKKYITMIDRNVEELDCLLIKLEYHHEETSKLISKIRNHMNYFKN